MRRMKTVFALSIALCLLVGCGTAGQQPETLEESELLDQVLSINEDAYTDRTAPLDIHVEAEAVALSYAPAAVPAVLLPEASGTAVEKNEKAEVDYSNIADGYVMARFTASTDKRLKAQVTGPTTTYTYDLPTGSWSTFPLSDGAGGYKVTVLENTTGTKYAVVMGSGRQPGPVGRHDILGRALWQNYWII